MPLFLQSVYSRLASYEDTNDAVRLAHDPAMQPIVGWRDGDRPVASANTMSRFGTQTLTTPENLKAQIKLNTARVGRAMANLSYSWNILNRGSTESPVHGRQEGSAYDGHFQSVCYRSLFLFNQFGDCEGCCFD